MWRNWFKPKEVAKYYGYTGPLEIERLAELIELGMLSICKTGHVGDIIRIQEGVFNLVVLERGYHWTKTEKNNGFVAEHGMHACCYNYGEGDKYLSVNVEVAQRFKKALDNLNKNKINNLLEELQLEHHKKMIDRLADKGSA